MVDKQMYQINYIGLCDMYNMVLLCRLSLTCLSILVCAVATTGHQAQNPNKQLDTVMTCTWMLFGEYNPMQN